MLQTDDVVHVNVPPFAHASPTASHPATMVLQHASVQSTDACPRVYWLVCGCLRCVWREQLEEKESTSQVMRVSTSEVMRVSTSQVMRGFLAYVTALDKVRYLVRVLALHWCVSCE